MSKSRIKKIYDIQLLGEKEVVGGMQRANKEFDLASKLVTKMKNNLVKNASLIIDPAELEKERLALINAEKALISETARKKEARAEAEALRAARQEERNQLVLQEQGNTRVANSYNELLAKIRILKAEQKNNVDLLNINDTDLAKSNEEIRKLQDRINAFNRSLSSEGTNVGEYTRGLVNALKSANLDGILGNQINAVKLKVQGLDNEFVELQQRLKESQNTGNQSLASIEKEIISNRMEAEKLNIQLASVAQTMNSVGNIGNKVTAMLDQNFKNLTGSVKHMVLGYASFNAVLGLTRNIKDTAYELSDQMTNLEIELDKATGGADDLAESLSKIDTRTSVAGLTEIMNVASKAGTAEQNILGVTRAVDVTSRAFGKDFGPIEEGTETFVKLINIFYEDREITGDRILKIGNAIRTLANETVASVPFINDFNGRMAGLKQLFKNLSLSDSIGLGAGFEEFKQSAEVATTALSKVLPVIANNTEKYAKIVGKTQEEFSKLINDNPVEALIQVSEALVKSGEDVEAVSSAFADAELGAGRIGNILAALGGKADVFRERIKRAGDAIQDTTAIEEAFNRKNENLAAIIDKIGKKFADLGNNKKIQKLLITISSLILGIITTILSIPFGWWVAGVTLLTLAYWENIKALTINIAQHTIYIARMAAGNILIVAGTALQYAQAIAVGVLNAAYWLLNMTFTALGIVIPVVRSAWLALSAAMSASPIGVIIGAIISLGYAYTKLTKYIDSASKSLKDQGRAIRESVAEMKVHAEVSKKIGESTADTLSKIDALTKIISDNNISLRNRTKALQQLIDINPEYLKGLTLENITTAEGTEILEKYKKKLIEVAKAKAVQDIFQESSKKIIEAQMKLDDVEVDAKKERALLNQSGRFIKSEYWGLILKKGKSALGLGDDTKMSQAIDAYKDLQDARDKQKVILDKYLNLLNIGLNENLKDFGGIGDNTDDDNKKISGQLTGVQKDYLKDIDAIRDTLLAKNEKAYTMAEISEKEYLQNILTINKDAWAKKLNYIKGINVEEKKQRAQWENERAKLEKDTHEKLFDIDAKALKKKYDLDKKRLDNELKSVTENPYSSGLDKTEAQQEYYANLLDLAINFDESMNNLEKKYNQNIIESANERATEVLNIERQLNNNSYKLTEERFEKQKDLVNSATDNIVNEKNINTELAKQKVLLDTNLSTRQKENEINRIISVNELELADAELYRIQSLIKLYYIKLETDKLSVEQKKELNALLERESKLLSDTIEKSTQQNKIGFGKGKVSAPSNSNTQDLIKEQIFKSINLDEDAYDSMIGNVISQSWDLATTAMNNYFNSEEARIQKSKELSYQRIDLEKEQKLAQAQSQAERDSIEKQATEKKKIADKEAAQQLKRTKKAEAKIALATELANIWSTVWQLGPIAGSTMGTILTGLARVRYAMNVKSIDTAKYKRGGRLSKLFGLGGQLIGPSHTDGGIPAINPITGEKVAEFEGDEGIVNKNSMKDSNVYTVIGTPSQIVSRINGVGGGIEWMGGATIKKWEQGGYLGSQVRPPVFNSYYEPVTKQKWDNDNFERMERLEKNLEKTYHTLEREISRKIILNPNEVTRYQYEHGKQTKIATL